MYSRLLWAFVLDAPETITGRSLRPICSVRDVVGLGLFIGTPIRGAYEVDTHSSALVTVESPTRFVRPNDAGRRDGLLLHAAVVDCAEPTAVEPTRSPLSPTQGVDDPNAAALPVRSLDGRGSHARPPTTSTCGESAEQSRRGPARRWFSVLDGPRLRRRAGHSVRRRPRTHRPALPCVAMYSRAIAARGGAVPPDANVRYHTPSCCRRALQPPDRRVGTTEVIGIALAHKATGLGSPAGWPLPGTAPV